jgi:hypothetical protein
VTTKAAYALTVQQAEDLAERILAAIDADDLAFVERFGHRPPFDSPREKHRRIDRERIASDLDGLRDHHRGSGILTDECGRCYQMSDPCDDARRYADGLLRTAALYGVTKGSASCHPYDEPCSPKGLPCRNHGGTVPKPDLSASGATS